MIRINLLPFRAARKKENIRRQLSVYGLTLVFVLLVLGYFYVDFNKKVGALEADKAQKNAQLAQYAKTDKRIKELKARIKEIRTKLKVIKGLEEKKTGPVRLLDEVAMAVPKDKLWLTSLTEKEGILSLTGTAMDNDTVALFMTNLEKAELVNSVDLSSTKLRHLEAYKLNVSDFELTCKTYSFEEKPKEPPRKGRRRR